MITSKVIIASLLNGVKRALEPPATVRCQPTKLQTFGRLMFERNQKLKCNLKSHGKVRQPEWQLKFLGGKCQNKQPSNSSLCVLSALFATKFIKLAESTKNVYSTFRNSINTQIEMKNIQLHMCNISDGIHFSHSKMAAYDARQPPSFILI